MPCRYVIDKERRVVITTGWDRVTFEDIQAHDEQLRNDPDFKPEFNQLVDGRATTVLDMSPEEARSLARRNVFSPTSRRAIVETRPANFGMVRLWSAYQEMGEAPSDARVFHDLPSALKWIGLEETPPHRPG